LIPGIRVTVEADTRYPSHDLGDSFPSLPTCHEPRSPATGTQSQATSGSAQGHRPRPILQGHQAAAKTPPSGPNSFTLSENGSFLLSGCKKGVLGKSCQALPSLVHSGTARPGLPETTSALQAASFVELGSVSLILNTIEPSLGSMVLGSIAFKFTEPSSTVPEACKMLVHSWDE
jgi:hypothetical protein